MFSPGQSLISSELLEKENNLISKQWSLGHVSTYKARAEGSRVKGQTMISNYHNDISALKWGPFLSSHIHERQMKMDEYGLSVFFSSASRAILLVTYHAWKIATYGLRNLLYKEETAA